jgi:hypothetical protein
MEALHHSVLLFCSQQLEMLPANGLSFTTRQGLSVVENTADSAKSLLH